MESLLLIFGGIIILWFFINQNTQANQAKKKKKDVEIGYKIKHQNFILAVKKIFPNSNLSILSSDCAVLNYDLLNPNKKKVGKIELSDYVQIHYSTNSTIDIYITITVLGRTFEKKQKDIENDLDSLFIVIESLINEIYSDQGFKQIVNATMY